MRFDVQLNVKVYHRVLAVHIFPWVLHTLKSVHTYQATLMLVLQLLVVHKQE